jgi:hypothetical protein
VALIMALSRALVGDGTPKMPDDYTLLIV